MSARSYTLLDVAKVLSFRAGNIKNAITTLENPDDALTNMTEVINQVIRDMVRVKGLPAMNGRYTFHTEDEHTDGTVSLTQGSNEVTGNNTAWASDIAGRAFSVATKNAVFRISSCAGINTLQLDTEWPFTSVSAAAYTIAQDRYSLPADFGDFINATLEGSTVRELFIKRPSEITHQRHNLRTVVMSVGTPTMISVFDFDVDGNWQCEVDPFPDDAYKIHAQYRKIAVRLTHDNDLVPVLDEHIDILTTGIVALWKEVTGIEGFENAYEKWNQLTLPRYAALTSKSTDEVARFLPDDVMRQASNAPMSTDQYST